MNPQFTNTNPCQSETDLVCAAELRGRHEQQLSGLERGQMEHRASLEKGQENLRQDVGDLRKDIKDVMVVIGKNIDENHKALMASNANTDTKIDAMGTKIVNVSLDVAKLQEASEGHDDSIKELRSYIIGIIVAFISGVIGFVTWLAEKYPIHFGGN